MTMLRAIHGALAIGDDDYVRRFINDRYEIISSEIIDSLRWSDVVRDVITDGTHFVELVYHIPATEYQDCELNMQIRAVQPVEKMVTVYE